MDSGAVTKGGTKKMAGLGPVAIVLQVIVILREVLEAAGVDRNRIVDIVEGVRERLRDRFPGSATDESEVWEYSVLTLGHQSRRTRSGALVPKLRDGVELQRIDVAGYLNQMSSEGWEILSAVEQRKSPSLSFARPKLARV
jgi:hypothetical protein